MPTKLGGLGGKVDVLCQLTFSEPKSSATDDLVLEPLQDVQVPKEIEGWTKAEKCIAYMHEDAQHDNGIRIKVDELRAIER